MNSTLVRRSQGRLSATNAPRFALAILAILLAVSVGASTRALAQAPKDSWIGIYLNGRKIGYASLHIENGTYKGNPALKVESKSVTSIELLGNKVSQDIVSTGFADSSFTPLYQEYKISSNGSALNLTAEYKPGEIECVLKSGTGTTKRTVTVPPGAKLIGDSTNATQGKKLPVGHKETFYALNPITLSLDKTDVEVKARESVKLGGKSFSALRVMVYTPFGTITSWEDDAGDLIKAEAMLGMTMYGESRDAALNMSSAMPAFAVIGAAPANGSANYKPPADFAIATAISVAKPITKPRETKSLAITVSGIDDKKLILSDERQRGAAVPGKADSYNIRVHVTLFDASRSATLPIDRTDLKLYQERAPYLETDDPAIRDAAAKVVGSEVNAYKAAAAIRAWVHGKMTPDYSIGVPRSCTDVLKRPRGVCRDYATLFAGIARAAGIPTRVVGGIVYAEGKFFYHTWVECWVGDWVPFDATMPTDYVDATHVKFAQGDVTQMYEAVRIAGRITLNVVSVE